MKPRNDDAREKFRRRGIVHSEHADHLNAAYARRNALLISAVSRQTYIRTSPGLVLVFFDTMTDGLRKLGTLGYTDTGPVPNSITYTTVVVVHGFGWSGRALYRETLDMKADFSRGISAASTTRGEA